MKVYYDVLKILDYDLDRLAFVIKHHYGGEKKAIIKDLENRNIEPYLKTMELMLSDIETTIQLSLNTSFKSELDYIKYLKGLLDINFIEYAECYIEPRKKRKGGNLFELQESN